MHTAVLHGIPSASCNNCYGKPATRGTITCCLTVVWASHGGVLVCRSPSEDQAHQLFSLPATALLCWTREATRL